MKYSLSMQVIMNKRAEAECLHGRGYADMSHIINKRAEVDNNPVWGELADFVNELYTLNNLYELYFALEDFIETENWYNEEFDLNRNPYTAYAINLWRNKRS